MTDDLRNRGTPVRLRVNVSADYEVRYWTEKWGVMAEALKAAVAKVGPSADLVVRELLNS